MGEIKWSGLNEADAKANFETLFKDADPDAKYYQNADGVWVIEASAMKTNIPAVTVDHPSGKPVLLTLEEHEHWKKTGEIKKVTK